MGVSGPLGARSAAFKSQGSQVGFTNDRTSLASLSAHTPVHGFLTTRAVAMAVLILIAMAASVAGAGGWLFPSQTSESVALVSMGCLLTIVAHLAQAFHHRATHQFRPVTEDEDDCAQVPGVRTSRALGRSVDRK